jgi:hypothetical protein
MPTTTDFEAAFRVHRDEMEGLMPTSIERAATLNYVLRSRFDKTRSGALLRQRAALLGRAPVGPYSRCIDPSPPTVR